MGRARKLETKESLVSGKAEGESMVWGKAGVTCSWNWPVTQRFPRSPWKLGGSHRKIFQSHSVEIISYSQVGGRRENNRDRDAQRDRNSESELQRDRK